MMTLVRWHPTRAVVTRRQEMNRLANEFFRGGIQGRGGWRAGSWTPAVLDFVHFLRTGEP